MRKYLPHVVEQLTSPPVKMQTNLLSFSRFLNKRKMVKECKKLWGYHHEDEIDHQIATAYFGIREAIKSGNSPMVLRHLSVDLYDQYLANPHSLKIEDGISDISILDCAKSKDENSATEWFHVQVVIKHFKVKHLYQIQRRIYTENYQFQKSFPRKWYFSMFPKQQ